MPHPVRPGFSAFAKTLCHKCSSFRLAVRIVANVIAADAFDCSEVGLCEVPGESRYSEMIGGACASGC
jgi:hypothetical protein